MKKRLTAIITLIIMTLCSIPAFAAGNNIVMSSDAESITYTFSAQQLEGYYFDSTVKYYTFSTPSLTVRADKNNFYDRDLAFVEFSLNTNDFKVKFYYKNGSERALDKSAIPMRYTVKGESITFYSVATFGEEIITSDKAAAGEMVFTTDKLGAFSVKNYEFTDVSDPKMWYYKYVNACAALGILSGMGDGSFKPDNTVTRAELCVMIVRSTSDVISYRTDESIVFNDVKKGKWYYDAITKCATMGIVFGVTPTEFKPDEPATREQIAALVSRVIRIAGSYGGNPLPDVSDPSQLEALYPDHADISNYAKADALLCNRLSVMVGDSAGFRPKSNTTRAECAVIFHSVKNSLY